MSTSRAARRARSRSSTASCSSRRRSRARRTRRSWDPRRARSTVGELDREVELIRSAHPEAVVAVEEQPDRGMFWIEVGVDAVVPVAALLRDHAETDYKLLSDLFGA